jgi:uncharacterized protein (DUF849 family)
MNHDVIISCAVTGDDTKVTKSPHCAVTPEQIAATAIAAAQAGAAIVHIHVRGEPAPSAGQALSRGWSNNSRSKVDVIVNPPAAWGYIVVSDHGLKDTPGPGSDFVSREDQMRQPSIFATKVFTGRTSQLDCGS